MARRTFGLWDARRKGWNHPGLQPLRFRDPIVRYIIHSRIRAGAILTSDSEVGIDGSTSLADNFANCGGKLEHGGAFRQLWMSSLEILLIRVQLPDSSAFTCTWRTTVGSSQSSYTIV